MTTTLSRETAMGAEFPSRPRPLLVCHVLGDDEQELAVLHEQPPAA